MKDPENNIIEQDLSVSPEKQAKELVGIFKTVSTAPTGSPKNFLDQIVIYTNSTTYRLYWYDSSANVWHYVTATA